MAQKNNNPPSYAYFTGAPQTAGKKKQRKLRVLPFVLLLLVVFGGCLGLGFYLAGYWSGYNPQKLSLPLWDPFVPKKFNVVLLGVDQRKNEPSRADSIMVAFLDLEKPACNLLSVPRDTYVNVPGHGMTKINHAHAYGGPELLCQTLGSFLGIPLASYVEVNFEGFQEIVDTLGGVEIEVEKRMYYPAEGINLYPGKQHLDGKNALAYVRYRGDALGDIGRVERQQKFLKAVAEQALQLRTAWKAPQLIPQVAESLKTNLALNEMVALARTLQDLEPENLRTVLLPGDSARIDGISYWVCKPAEVASVVGELTYPFSPGKKAQAFPAS